MSFTEELARERLAGLSGSQQSIETLSMWFRHYHHHGAVIAQAWRQAVHNAPPPRKLALVYLCNDILQNGRKHGFEQHFSAVLHDALAHCLHECPTKDKGSVQRVVRIWQERRVLPPALLQQLMALIDGEPAVSAQHTPSVLSHHHHSHRGGTAADLKEAVDAMEHTSAEDSSIMKQVSSLPDKLFSDQLLSTIKDQDSGAQLSQELAHACAVLASCQGRLAASFEDRSALIRALGACLDRQTQLARQTKAQLLECDRRAALVLAAQNGALMTGGTGHNGTSVPAMTRPAKKRENPQPDAHPPNVKRIAADGQPQPPPPPAEPAYMPIPTYTPTPRAKRPWELA